PGLSLSIVGSNVVARGAASGEMRGTVKGLLFRYKSLGGFEYMTDYLIGPLGGAGGLPTRPRHSGTTGDGVQSRAADGDGATRPRPLAIQWGGERLGTGTSVSPYVLASGLATVFRVLDLDLIRDWNDALFRYWGAVGHYGIALEAIARLPDGPL